MKGLLNRPLFVVDSVVLVFLLVPVAAGVQGRTTGHKTLNAVCIVSGRTFSLPLFCGLAV